MRKALPEMQEEIKKADLFIEVRDSRIPLTSHNPELIRILPQRMKKIVVFNKIDLANENKTMGIIKHVKELNKQQYADMVHVSTKKGINISRLLTLISQHAAGAKFKTVGSWVMIGGIPNVGKSTIINSVRRKDGDAQKKGEKTKKKKGGAKVGGIPCITKSITGFKIIADPATYMIDTPGIILPRIQDNSEDGLKLSVCHNIRDGILETGLVCDYLLFKLNKEMQFTYVERYALNMHRPTDNIHDLLNAIMNRFKMRDRQAACDALLRDFRDGKLGQITLDEWKNTPSEQKQSKTAVINL